MKCLSVSGKAKQISGWSENKTATERKRQENQERGPQMWQENEGQNIKLPTNLCIAISQFTNLSPCLVCKAHRASSCSEEPASWVKFAKRAATRSVTSSLAKQGLASSVQDHLWYGAAVETLHYSAVKTAMLWEVSSGAAPHPQELHFSSGPCSSPELHGRYTSAQLWILILPCWYDLLPWPQVCFITTDGFGNCCQLNLVTALLFLSRCIALPLLSLRMLPLPAHHRPQLAVPCGAACSYCSFTGNLIQIKLSLTPWPKCFYYMCGSKLSKEKLLCWEIGCNPPSSSELNAPI